MDKGPKRLLHMNQPTMHSINVTNLICNDPTIPRRQKLGRFRCITRATRTLPCNMIKRAKFSATIPNAHGRRTMRHPTTKSSRRERFDIDCYHQTKDLSKNSMGRKSTLFTPSFITRKSHPSMVPYGSIVLYQHGSVSAPNPRGAWTCRSTCCWRWRCWAVDPSPSPGGEAIELAPP